MPAVSLDSMGERSHRIFTEAYRFLAVGGLATVVALVIFNLLVHGFGAGYDAPLSGQPYLAYLIANLIGMVVSYRGSRSWVFKGRPPRTADGGRLMFVAINLVTMLIPIACLWISRNILGHDDPWADNVAANLGNFLGMLTRFYLFRTLVFQRPVVLAELKQNPLQVLEMSELQGEEDLRDVPTALSMSDPARRPAP